MKKEEIKKDGYSSIEDAKKESYEDFKKNLLKDADKNMSNTGMLILGIVLLGLAFIIFKFLNALALSFVFGIIGLIIVYASIFSKRVENLSEEEIKKLYEEKNNFSKNTENTAKFIAGNQNKIK